MSIVASAHCVLRRTTTNRASRSRPAESRSTSVELDDVRFMERFVDSSAHNRRAFGCLKDRPTSTQTVTTSRALQLSLMAVRFRGASGGNNVAGNDGGHQVGVDPQPPGHVDGVAGLGIHQRHLVDEFVEADVGTT